MTAEDSAPNGAGGGPARTADQTSHALSFAAVADTYDRARPSYPAEAAAWLVGAERAQVLELGAGTGKLTELLVTAGHDVLATDPLPEMLAILKERVPGARTAVANAERIPVPSRSVDVVVCAQAFHWFNHPVALDEIARVLRPDGVLALVWNVRDEAIPWVRKLSRIMGGDEFMRDLVGPLESSDLFGEVESHELRFWMDLRRDDLYDLVRSRSYIAVLPEDERTEVLERVGALYDDYGRGHDGMKLPYLTRCYRSPVTNQPPAPIVTDRLHDLDATRPGPQPGGQAPATPSPANKSTPQPPEDPGTVLIDFT